MLLNAETFWVRRITNRFRHCSEFFPATTSVDRARVSELPTRTSYGCLNPSLRECGAGTNPGQPKRVVQDPASTTEPQPAMTGSGDTAKRSVVRHRSVRAAARPPQQSARAAAAPPLGAGLRSLTFR